MDDKLKRLLAGEDLRDVLSEKEVSVEEKYVDDTLKALKKLKPGVHRTDKLKAPQYVYGMLKELFGRDRVKFKKTDSGIEDVKEKRGWGEMSWEEIEKRLDKISTDDDWDTPNPSRKIKGSLGREEDTSDVEDKEEPNTEPVKEADLDDDVQKALDALVFNINDLNDLLEENDEVNSTVEGMLKGAFKSILKDAQKLAKVASRAKPIAYDKGMESLEETEEETTQEGMGDLMTDRNWMRDVVDDWAKEFHDMLYNLHLPSEDSVMDGRARDISALKKAKKWMTKVRSTLDMLKKTMPK